MCIHNPKERSSHLIDRIANKLLKFLNEELSKSDKKVDKVDEIVGKEVNAWVIENSFKSNWNRRTRFYRAINASIKFLRRNILTESFEIFWLMQ